MSPAPTRRKYTKEFKLEAVRLSQQPGTFVTQVARDLGVRVKDLYRWRAEAKDAPTQAFRGHGRRAVQDEELEALRRENARLRQVQEILKKAAVFFASQSSGGSRS
jgi:transposase